MITGAPSGYNQHQDAFHLMNRPRIWIWMIFFTVLTGAFGCSNQPETVLTGNLTNQSTDSTRQSNDSIIQTASSLIRTGDLILRTGTDFSSEEVKAISPRDKTYSHAGIAVVDSSGIFIYHVEPDHLHVGDKVRKEPLDSFCNPSKNLGIAVARYELADFETKKFLNYLHDQYEKKIPFDIHFDLRSVDSLYCSEMIRKGLFLATNARLQIPTHRFNDRNKYKVMRQYLRLPEKSIANREIIPIDHLFLNPYCTVISRFKFYGHQSPQL